MIDKEIKEKIKTNRQWVESLSDEEIAQRNIKYFYQISYSDDEKSYIVLYKTTLPNPNHKIYDDCREVVKENLEWLQAEYKE